jgi:hypothetical protein
MKNKSEVYFIFLQFEALVSRKFNTKILAFHSDWGGEYQRLHSYFLNTGITYRIAYPYTHEQNGTVERKICHLVDTALTLLAHANLPKKYWNYALEQSAMLVNVLPSDVLQRKSPFYKLFNTHPNYLQFQPFGCSVFPLIRPYNSYKFSYRSIPCIYLGQSPLHVVYRCLDPTTGHIKFVRFHPKTYPCASLSISPLAQPAVFPWIMVDWTPTSLGHSTASGNISSPLSPTPSSLNPPTSLPSSDPSTVTPPTDHQLVVDLSHYSPLQNPLHQPPLQPAPGLPTLPDDRTHLMVLRPSTMHRRQANTTTSITKPLL